MKTIKRIEATIKVLINRRNHVKTYNEEIRINNTIRLLQKQLSELSDDNSGRVTSVNLKLAA